MRIVSQSIRARRPVSVTTPQRRFVRGLLVRLAPRTSPEELETLEQLARERRRALRAGEPGAWPESQWFRYPK